MKSILCPLALAAALLPAIALADPCGMVPPMWDGQGPPIVRVGIQQTYVFFKEGVESFVIRPSFEGKVDEFGMLIPFPSPPAIRKVDDQIFTHLGNAVEPPPVTVDLRIRARRWRGNLELASLRKSSREEERDEDARLEVVNVVREEAVGMYEVAVLDAGSAKALKRWMDDHGYRYPEGMGEVVEDYVNLGWCFVAVKTKVGHKPGVTPRAGMRRTKAKLAAGSTFDGAVQAMGFRFRTPEMVVPMRLSAFNPGQLRNRVFLLTERPVRIDNIPTEYVVRQLPGRYLYRNVTDLLPLHILGGTLADLTSAHMQRLAAQRNPEPRNGHARDLFASDLEAVYRNLLSLPHEEQEKLLLKIGERLGLRGKRVDAMHNAALRDARSKIVARSLSALDSMTLTVIDGDFPRDVLKEDNLHFSEWLREDLEASQFAAPVSIKSQPVPAASPVVQSSVGPVFEDGKPIGRVASHSPLPNSPSLERRPLHPASNRWLLIALVILGAAGLVGFALKGYGTSAKAPGETPS
jgi:hypothetical protein